MKLFDRTPTGRPSFRRRPSYSKEYKPFIHKLKRVLGHKSSRFLMMGLCCVCLMFIVLIIYSPNASSSSSLPIHNENTAVYKNDSIHLQLAIDDHDHDTPSQDAEPSSSLYSFSSLSDLMHKFMANPETIDMPHIEQLLSHRNDLEKHLKTIDDLLIRHKDKISALLPTKSTQNELNDIPNEYKLNKSPQEIRGEIMTEFKYAWDCYKECAWGFDTLHPISCTGSNDAFDLGLAMIDALDTMIIMHTNDAQIYNFEDDLAAIKQWITDKMRFDHKQEVALFESTIRILGGLLSAFHLTNDTIYLQRSQQLGDKLMIAFDTPSGIPYASIDFVRNRAFNPSWSRSATSTSEAASVQLEFNMLSYVTNDNKYAETARKAQQAVMKAQRNADPPLLRKFIDIKHGRFTDNKISFGSRIDSSYEYYLKVPLQLGHHPQTNDIWNMYLESIATAEKELFAYSGTNHRFYIAEMVGGSVSDQFDHLVCFMGGALALGSLVMNDSNALKEKHFTYGQELTETCYSIYNETGTHLAPEIVYFNRNKKNKKDFDIHSRDTHNLLRPETVESIFYLYRMTHDPKYRYYGYQIFKAFREYTKITETSNKGKCGYASIKDVTVKQASQIKFRGDKMESFFLAETLKYLYLLFHDDNVIDIHKYVFNTEAHPLPILSKHEANKLFN